MQDVTIDAAINILAPTSTLVSADPAVITAHILDVLPGAIDVFRRTGSAIPFLRAHITDEDHGDFAIHLREGARQMAQVVAEGAPSEAEVRDLAQAAFHMAMANWVRDRGAKDGRRRADARRTLIEATESGAVQVRGYRQAHLGAIGGEARLTAPPDVRTVISTDLLRDGVIAGDGVDAALVCDHCTFTKLRVSREDVERLVAGDTSLPVVADPSPILLDASQSSDQTRLARSAAVVAEHPPKPATAEIIRAAISAIYGKAAQQGEKPPNVKQAVTPALNLIRSQGYECTRIRIESIVDEPQFKALRLGQGQKPSR